MIAVGLTGGLATGKTFVAHSLKKLGCHVVHADQLGHQVLRRGGAAFDAVVARFGTAFLDENREIDRKKLAALVFGDHEKLQALNGLVHPAVFQLEDEFVRSVQCADPDGIAVVEAAILIESGNYRRFDRIIVTVCSAEAQMARATGRDGITPESVRRRLAHQMPLDEKRLWADYTVDTSGPKANTIEQVKKIYGALVSLSEAGLHHLAAPRWRIQEIVEGSK